MQANASILSFILCVLKAKPNKQVAMKFIKPKFRALREKFKDLIRKTARAAKLQTRNGKEAPSVLKPILINSTGRSGTTLLMQLLGTSPQIVFDRYYPFEVRYLTYLLRWSLLLNEPWKPNESWNPAENLKHPGTGLIGPFPYSNAQYWHAMGGKLWPRCFETVWQEFSSTSISNILKKSSPERYPKYYAEKVSPWVFEYLEQQPIPYNVITLIRDPRDVFLSINSFDRQRGFHGFGRSANDTDFDFAKQVVSWYRNMHTKKNITAPNNILVKYEHLASNLTGEAQRLDQWLNIKLDASLVKQQEKKFIHHMTSANSTESIARWRHELSDELNTFFIQELGEELRYFGYES